MLRRVGAALAVLALLVPLPAGAQLGGSDEPYSFYAVRASADGVLARFAIEGFLPIEEFVGLSSVSSEANLGTLRSSSLAALPDPGELVLTLPGTLSALAGVSGLPSYPAAVSADHPTRPEEELTLVPDAGLGVGRLRAAADLERASATAAVTDLRDTVGLLPAFSIGSIRTEATAAKVRPGTLEAVATSTISDIRVAGGLLRIAGITTRVEVGVVDGVLSAEEPEVTVAGVELAGTPVGITRDGLVGLGQPTALAPVVNALLGPLKALGVDVSVTDGATEVTDDQVTASSGALRIAVPLTVLGFPGGFTLELAPVSVSLQATAAPEASEAPGGPGGGTVAPGAPGGSPVATPPVPSPSGGVDLPPVTPTSPSAPEGQGGGGQDTELVAIPAPREIADWSVRGAYGWMALAALAMLAAGPAALLLGARWARRSDLRPFWRW